MDNFSHISFDNFNIVCSSEIPGVIPPLLRTGSHNGILPWWWAGGDPGTADLSI